MKVEDYLSMTKVVNLLDRQTKAYAPTAARSIVSKRFGAVDEHATRHAKAASPAPRTRDIADRVQADACPKRHSLTGQQQLDARRHVLHVADDRGRLRQITVERRGDHRGTKRLPADDGDA